jgi:hypothetical protein
LPEPLRTTPYRPGWSTRSRLPASAANRKALCSLLIYRTQQAERGFVSAKACIRQADR